MQERQKQALGRLKSIKSNRWCGDKYLHNPGDGFIIDGRGKQYDLRWGDGHLECFVDNKTFSDENSILVRINRHQMYIKGMKNPNDAQRRVLKDLYIFHKVEQAFWERLDSLDCGGKVISSGHFRV